MNNITVILCKAVLSLLFIASQNAFRRGDVEALEQLNHHINSIKAEMPESN